jgi:hypothetical protein
MSLPRFLAQDGGSQCCKSRQGEIRYRTVPKSPGQEVQRDDGQRWRKTRRMKRKRRKMCWDSGNFSGPCFFNRQSGIDG